MVLQQDEKKYRVTKYDKVWMRKILSCACGSPRSKSSLQLVFFNVVFCNMSVPVWSLFKSSWSCNFWSCLFSFMFACLYCSFHLRAQRQFPRQGALQCETQNILNTEMSKAATLTIAGNATSPRLTLKELNLHNYLQWICSRRPSSILNERQPRGKIAHLS